MPVPENHQTHLLFLFGLAGSGKSYVGDVLANHYGWQVYHADQLLTEAMCNALEQHLPFSDDMRDEYFAQLADKIRELQQRYPNLIITQAAYRQRHRSYLQQLFPTMELIWIKASDATIHKRLLQRQEGISLDSAQALRADFETPAADCKQINNDGDAAAILHQFQTLYTHLA